MLSAYLRPNGRRAGGITTSTWSSFHNYQKKQARTEIMYFSALSVVLKLHQLLYYVLLINYTTSYLLILHTSNPISTISECPPRISHPRTWHKMRNHRFRDHKIFTKIPPFKICHHQICNWIRHFRVPSARIQPAGNRCKHQMLSHEPYTDRPSYLQSRVDVIVGPRHTKFEVPFFILEWLSPAFADKLIKPPSDQPDRNPHIRWLSIREGTFINLCEYAYTGSYYTALEPAGISAAPVLRFPHHGWMGNAETRRITDLNNSLEEMRRSLRALCPQIPKGCLIPHAAYRNSPGQNYSYVFKAHADLFIAAQEFHIEPLKKAVLDRLEAMFIALIHYPEILKNLVELAEYAYARCPWVPPASRCLRRHVMRTMAFLVEGFGEIWPELEALLDKHPEARADWEQGHRGNFWTNWWSWQWRERILINWHGWLSKVVEHIQLFVGYLDV